MAVAGAALVALSQQLGLDASQVADIRDLVAAFLGAQGAHDVAVALKAGSAAGGE